MCVMSITFISPIFAQSINADVAVQFSKPEARPYLNDTLAEPAPPEEEKRHLKISGIADFYYRFDPSRQLYNNKTAFTNTQNAFALGMASVKFEHDFDRAGVVLDLGVGPRAREFSYNDDGAMAAIKQLYISYRLSPKLKVTAGTWGTHIGYEVLDPQLNRNYSMGYMFSYGPFSHTGIKAEFTAGDHAFMAGVSNPTDYRQPPAHLINSKFLIAQYSFAKGDKFKLYLNYVGGKNVDTGRVHQYDAVATYKINSKFNVALNASLNHTANWIGYSKSFTKPKDWWGTAGYLNFDPTDWLGLTLRTEYFNDNDLVKGFGTHVWSNTVSASFKKGGFTFIPEIRCDESRSKIYLDNNGKVANKEINFLVACIYSF